MPLNSLPSALTSSKRIHASRTFDAQWRAWFGLVIFGIVTGLAVTCFAVPLAGTKSIGPSGDYTSVGAALADVQAQGLSGALVLELQATYDCSVESFPLTIGNLGTSATNTLTLRPQLGATGLVITSGDTSAATMDLNGTAYVTIDGRPGGLGDVGQLTIKNTDVSGVALRFINGSSYCSVQYASLRGVNTSPSSGVVVFGSTTGPVGCWVIYVDHCDIGDIPGLGTPTNGVYALGNATMRELNNTIVTISNNNIFNFHSSADDTEICGVRIDPGNTAFFIKENHFYQTEAHAYGRSDVRAIYLNDSASYFTVRHNYIGGSAPELGGPPWLVTASAKSFVGIQLNVSNSGNFVKDNVIGNFTMTTSNASGTWKGISGTAGKAYIENSVIGGTTSPVRLNSSDPGGLSGGTFVGIEAGNAYTVKNNTIGVIETAGLYYGIKVGGAAEVEGNRIGSDNPSATLGLTALGDVLGIQVGSGPVTDNFVAGLSSETGRVRGIVAYGSVVERNVVCRLKSNMYILSVWSQPWFSGIECFAPYGGVSCARNVVHSIESQTLLGAPFIAGIYVGNNRGNRVEGNFVHSLSVKSSNVSSQLRGLDFASEVVLAANNMVRIGIDLDGVSTAGGATIRGIYNHPPIGKTRWLHNTVFVGGNQTAGASNTVAFDNVSTVVLDAIENNIFVNARSNAGGTGKHYVIRRSDSGITTSRERNIFYFPGVGGLLGSVGGLNRASLFAWQSATNGDTSSAVVDPMLVNPSGDANTVDLHIQPLSPAEGEGLVRSEVTVDYDGDSRDEMTPADIGADAGNYVRRTDDLFAPIVTNGSFTGSTVANPDLPSFSIIRDNREVATGDLRPRLYFKKTTDADIFGGNTAADNGWKYVLATNDTSPYSFTIDFGLLAGGGVVPGDVIQYFVVAQDVAGNVTSSPVGAQASANPPIQNISSYTPASATRAFGIHPSLSGVKTVGGGGDFASMTGVGGVFDTINRSILVGDLTVVISGDTIETGETSISSFRMFGGGVFTVTIKPSSSQVKTLSGSSTNALLAFSGVDGLVIDGRFNGQGRYLLFRNQSTGRVFELRTDASSNTIRNCIIEGAGSSLLHVGFGGTTGNDDNLFAGNLFRSLGDGAQESLEMISAGGTNPVVSNSNNTIADNEIIQLGGTAVSIGTVGNDAWSIINNSIHDFATGIGSKVGIATSASGTCLISGNVIEYSHSPPGGTLLGISCSGVSSTTISNNRVSAVGTTGTGIQLAGGNGSVFDVINNQVAIIPTNTQTGMVLGILDDGVAGGVCNVFHNSVLVGSAQSSISDSRCVRREGSTNHSSRNNVFINQGSGTSGNRFAVSNVSLTGAYQADYNLYVGSGITTASFMEHSNASNVPVAMGFDEWKTTMSGDSHSQALVNSQVNVANLFINPNTGDLRLVSTNNPLVRAKGVPMAEVPADMEGELRSLVAPSLGADDQPPPTSGSVTVAPSLTVDPGTAVTVSFAGWSDDQGPLNYQVLVDGISTAAASTSSNVAFIAPMAVGPHVVKAIITDALGAATEVDKTLTVVVGTGALAFEQNLATAIEGDGPLPIKVKRIGGSEGTLMATVSSINGTALAGKDYTSVVSQLLVFEPGVVEQTINVAILADAVLNEPNETFVLKLTGTKLGSVGQMTVRIVDAADSTIPSLPVIASPLSNARVGAPTGSAIVVSGLASDNKGISAVEVTWNGAGPVPAVLSNVVGVSAQWSVSMVPQTGPNTFTVRSTDTRGNQSALVTRSFVCTRPLIVNSVGASGSFTRGFYPSSMREVGSLCTLTATPPAGFLFANWTLSGVTARAVGLTDAALQLPTIGFIFREGLVVNANFSPNPYLVPGIAGIYNGNIRADETLPDLAPSGAGPEDGTPRSNATEGAITFTVLSSGAFTGRVSIEGLTLAIAGTFDEQGKARFGASRSRVLTIPRSGRSPLLGQFEIHVGSPPSGTLSGSLVDPEVAVSNVIAHRAHWNGTTLIPADLLRAGYANGVFNVRLENAAPALQSPELTAADYPQGWGLATATVTKAGTVSVAGTLSDGTAFTAASTLSQNKVLHLYASLYGKRGGFLGDWLFDTTQANSDVSGTNMAWLRPILDDQYYAGGWPSGLVVEALGTKFAPPATGTSVMPGLAQLATEADGNATLAFAEGSLGAVLTKTMGIAATDVVTNLPVDTSFKVTLNRRTGMFSGFFTQGSAKPTFQGIIVNKGATKSGNGFFKTVAPVVKDYTGQAGRVVLQAQ